jgi:hypothetical protein
MSFTRTPAGVANYKLFFGADFVVFIEGKSEGACSEDEVIADEVFYETLVKYIFPDKSIKIKCVGNSDDVVENVNKLISAGDDAGFGIIDRDSEGVLYSSVQLTNRIVLTKGYSWENDLWSDTTFNKTTRRLVIAKNDVYSKTYKTFRRGMGRLGLLCRLDFSSRIHETSLFRKNKNSCGLGIDGSCSWGVPLIEMRRFIKKYKQGPAYTCTNSRRILNDTSSMSLDSLVQGHLKHSLVCNIIASAFQSVHRKSHLAHQVILNAALSLYRDDPLACLGTETYSYYENEFRLASA